MPTFSSSGHMFQILSQSSGVNLYTVDEVLSPYVYVFCAAFLVSWIFTPVMRLIAVYYKIIDQPDLQRKIHRTPVAYLGGVALFLGWISGLATSQFLGMHRIAPGLTHVVISTGILAGGCVIIVLGLIDDLIKLRPTAKIVGQIAAAVMLLASGIGLNLTRALLTPIQIRAGQWWGLELSDAAFDTIVLYTSCALVVALVVFCCNATNLMDGLDGLCGGVTAIIAFGLAVLAVYLGMGGGSYDINLDALRVVLALALLGGVLGFVPYNFNPASIFMGDTGSMFLGFTCALMIILVGEVAAKWFLAAMVMFALPILDTSLAFARRWVNGRPLFSADKQHFHHQLVARGLSVRKAVLTNYILAIAFVLFGAAVVFMRTRYAVSLYLVIFCSIIVAAYKMGMVHERPVVVTRKPLEGGAVVETPEVAASSVVEIRERTAAPTSNAVSPPGAWTGNT